jgi:hypothetical protein
LPELLSDSAEFVDDAERDPDEEHANREQQYAQHTHQRISRVWPTIIHDSQFWSMPMLGRYYNEGTQCCCLKVASNQQLFIGVEFALEVHPPHKPIHSIREFMVHLLAITIGLLIALALQAAVEWLHDRSLVREARENMAQEIRENQKSLALELKALPGEKRELEGILRMAADVQHSRPAQQHREFNWKVTRLGESAWNTTASSGALARMSYTEAREYAQLYSLQEMFNANMDRYVDSRAEMYAFLNRMELRDKPSAVEFEAGEHIIGKGLVMADFLREIGNKLNAAYTTFLAVGR